MFVVGRGLLVFSVTIHAHIVEEEARAKSSSSYPKTSLNRKVTRRCCHLRLGMALSPLRAALCRGFRRDNLAIQNRGKGKRQGQAGKQASKPWAILNPHISQVAAAALPFSSRSSLEHPQPTTNPQPTSTTFSGPERVTSRISSRNFLTRRNHPSPGFEGKYLISIFNLIEHMLCFNVEINHFVE
jgi:hypothetical protein